MTCCVQNNFLQRSCKPSLTRTIESVSWVHQVVDFRRSWAERISGGSGVLTAGRTGLSQKHQSDKLNSITQWIKVENGCHDMNDPPTYPPPLTNCHTYQMFILVLLVTEVPARRILISRLIALRPYVVYISV